MIQEAIQLVEWWFTISQFIIAENIKSIQKKVGYTITVIIDSDCSNRGIRFYEKPLVSNVVKKSCIYQNSYQGSVTAFVTIIELK